MLNGQWGNDGDLKFLYAQFQMANAAVICRNDTKSQSATDKISWIV